MGFSIGTKAYIVTGYDGSASPNKKDFWEWDQSTNVWSRKADFGGAPQDLCDTKGLIRGGWCGGDNNIYFGHISKEVSRVPSEGGTIQSVTKLDSASGEISHRFLQLLPNGKALVFTIKHNNISTFDDAVVAVQRLDTGERKIVLRGGTFARYVPTGHLIYARDLSIFAVPFDADKLEVTGPPLPLFEGGMLNQASGEASISFSNSGVLVYADSGPISINRFRIVWMDRQGKTLPLVDLPRPYFDGRISPDGQKLALQIQAANDDIWIYHIGRGTLTRLTFGGGNNNFPI